MDSYTRGEVAWLLGISHGEAQDLDAPVSSWSGGPAPDGDARLPVVVLRSEVHAAAVRVAMRARAAGAGHEAGMTLVVLALRGRGETLRDVAAVLGVSHTHVARRFDAGVLAVLEELGEPAAAVA